MNLIKFSFWKSFVDFHVCSFGGGSSSAAATTTTNTDKRLVVDSGAIGLSSDNSTINFQTLDAGAVSAGTGLASQALISNTANFKTLMDTAALLAKSATSALTDNVKLAGQLTTSTQSAYADASQNAAGNKNIVYAGLAVVAMVGVSFMWKKG